MNTVQSIETTTGPNVNVVTRRRYFPAINWGAIIAGIVVGMATQVVLTLLGLAAGLSAIDVTKAEAGVSNAPIWVGVWQGITMLIAAFVGGYVAARMSGLQRNGDGMLHGLVAWGATTLIVASLAASAFGALFGGILPMVGQTVARAGGVSAPAATAQGTRMEDLLRREIPSAGAAEPSPQAMTTLFQHIRAGDRQAAINQLQSMGISSERATTIVDQALVLSGSPAASPAARARADENVETASATSWWVFAAVALSMLLGIGGGLLGAAGSQRSKHTNKEMAPAA